jgi:hypothetical protein
MRLQDDHDRAADLSNVAKLLNPHDIQIGF